MTPDRPRLTETRTNFRTTTVMYERLQSLSHKLQVPMNTLIGTGVQMALGDKMYHYRIESIFIPQQPGVAREGAEAQSISRRILHILDDRVRNDVGGRVIQVLTEEVTGDSDKPLHIEPPLVSVLTDGRTLVQATVRQGGTSVTKMFIDGKEVEGTADIIFPEPK